MEQKTKFYQSQWFMWLLLVFLPPVGIIFMWVTKKEFSAIKKVLLTFAFLFWWLICAILGSIPDDATPTTDPTTETTTEATTAGDTTEANTEATTEAVTESSATLGETNALAKAKLYLKTSAFSYAGLIAQLEYEGFTTEEATYGADNCEADWKEQAALKAKDYMNTSSFSKEGLIDQLLYEEFTQEEAEYGATAVGY